MDDHLQPVVSQIQESYYKNGIAEFGQGLIFGSWVLELAEIDDRDGRERHGE